MTPRRARLHSTDPLDHLTDPQAHFADPVDQSNANPEFDIAQLDDEQLGAAFRAHMTQARALDYPPPATLDVRALRERMRTTQREFACWFGFSVATLRHWERGNRKPVGTALVLLHVIRENPRVVLQAVRKARVWQPGIVPPIERLKSYRASPGWGERQPARRPRGPRRQR